MGSRVKSSSSWRFPGVPRSVNCTFYMACTWEVTRSTFSTWFDRAWKTMGVLVKLSTSCEKLKQLERWWTLDGSRATSGWNPAGIIFNVLIIISDHQQSLMSHWMFWPLSPRTLGLSSYSIFWSAPLSSSSGALGVVVVICRIQSVRPATAVYSQKYVCIPIHMCVCVRNYFYMCVYTV